MYACKNCGRNVKFDIEKQCLYCEACSSTFDPYDIVKESDATSDTYQTNVFTCPSCGGEIRTEENEATGVCIYCGGENILTSRISNEKKPEYIIPFQITKEKCNEIYANKLKKYIFAPSEIRKKMKADSFRGIYMPYWVYSIKQSGQITVKGKREYNDDGKSISETYSISGDIYTQYAGVSYDASSSFPDNMSQVIAPYDINEIKEFTPSFLSGFYADVSDTPGEVYCEEAQDIANENTKEKLIDKVYPVKLDLDENLNLSTIFHTECEDQKSAMFPVWFMSFKHHNRMSYSVINGQTGDIYADIPISIRKYLLGVLIVFIPIFLVLNLFTLTPSVLAFLTGVFSLITILIFNKESNLLYLSEHNLDDRGYCYHNGMPMPKHKKLKSKKNKEDIQLAFFGVLAGVMYILISAGALIAGIIIFIAYGLYVTRLYGMICPIIAIVFFIVGQVKYFKLSKKIMPTIVSAAVSLSAGLFFMVNPVYNEIYYAVAIIGILSVIFNIVCIVRIYNRMSTRPMPQFNRNGGDDDAV